MHVNDITPLPLYDPAQNVEGYTQELLARWLKFYFSGVPFQYRDLDTLVTKTLPECDFGFAETPMPTNMDKPYIHCYLVSATDDRRSKVGRESLYISHHRMAIEVMVPSSLSTLESLPGDRAEHHCRAVADALYWLMETQERGALIVAGLQNFKPLRRPVVTAAPTGFFKRSFLVAYKFSYKVR